MGLDINLNTSKIDISENDGLNVDLYKDNIDISDDEADDIIIEITGLKSINKFIGLEDTPLYYDNGKFFKVEDNKIIYTDIQWKDISGDISESPEIIAVISDLVNEVASDIVDERINLHNLNEEAHPYIQNIIQENYNTLDIKIDDTKEELSQDISNLNDALNQEISDRETADNALSEDIQEEILDRIEGDTTLQGEIDTLNTNLQNEIDARIEGDTNLSNSLDELSDNLIQEVLDRQEQDGILQEQITSNYNTLDGKIDTEISNRTSADTTLQNNIDAEASTRQGADTELQNNIDTLSNIVLSNYTTLNTKIDNTKISLEGDINNLSTTVTDNYNTLSGQIRDLTTTVNDNYNSLDNRLTTAEGGILNLTDTVNDNYTELNGKITTTNNNLSTLSQTVEDNNTAINNRVDGIVESFDGDISDLNDAIDNLSDTVSDNYTELNDKITDNTDDITTIQNTINSYGDIVSYNATYFATASQGALADTALQPNDNISELVNDVGYITSASLPTVNNATITIQKNGSSVGTFTLNQANNDTLNITVPTQASDIGAMPDTTTIEDLTTTAQLNALNSGATATNIGQITTNQNNIADIRDLIPLQASTSNQLADKNFVNSSIATNTAYFIGTFNSVAELEAYSGPLTNNDYAFVATTDSAGNTLYDRYKYNADTQQWIFEYELNNSSFTAQQWASINSGITSGDVTLIGTALQPNDNISELTNDAGYITSSALTNYVTTNTDQSISGTKTFRTISVSNITNALNTTILRTYAGVTEVGTTNSHLLLKSNLERPYFNNTSNTLALSSDIPTVNNGTLDIQVNGTSIGTFTANQSGNTTANIVVPDSATWGNITGTLSNQTDLQTALNSKYDASNPNGYITSVDLPTNYVTTDTAQDISGRKTFLGEKAIYFKQNATTDKLGFTLCNPSNAELGALEWRPNTINGNALLALNCPQTGSSYVGFRYWSGINVVAPRPTTNGNYFIPVNVTDGTNTVTANNNGTLNISTLLPDVSNFVTNSSLATILADYQPLLVSGTNIKTINNNSILGSGNLTLDGLPSQTGQAGKFLTTNGTDASWADATKVTIRDWSVS